MHATTLQMVEVNQTTLIQWHNNRVKVHDVSLLCQGVDLPHRVPVAAKSSPFCQHPPCCCLLNNLAWSTPTTCQRAQWGRRSCMEPLLPVLCVVHPAAAPPPLHPPPLCLLSPKALGSCHSPPSHWPHLPLNQLPPRPAQGLVSQTIAESVGEHRTAATGHSQYKGHIFCPSFETLTKQQWLANKREEDKKK
ncbi:hypothetical protein SKAU_G00056470 [Synaphobranchus kaupii]|uniref:Uncharacterized protein n=1 Tax=Synaphobranchus kaupii TaxID=118154 RepID=A0A9Q1G418_SYNKA|nr:hypothetical protein SKAU_G00056470 [Synaphobranchus kaupii]